MRIFYRPEQNVAGNTSFSPSAGKPAAFVAAALERFPGRLEVLGGFRGFSAKGLSLAHDPGRVAAILECKEENGFSNRLPAVAASLPWTTGSFYAAARAVALDGGAACSPTSGFHHAGYSFGGGYCTFNGLAVAAIMLRKEGLARKIGIADFDAHYGNGTDDIIQRLGIDYIVNHSLGGFIDRLSEPGGAERWIAGLGAELEEKFSECDLLFYQAGADPHVSDPLGGYLRGEQLRARDEAVFAYAKRSGKPIAWNLAGGYQKPLTKVIELHLATLGECLRAFEGSDAKPGALSPPREAPRNTAS